MTRREFDQLTRPADLMEFLRNRENWAHREPYRRETRLRLEGRDRLAERAEYRRQVVEGADGRWREDRLAGALVTGSKLRAPLRWRLTGAC